MTMKAYIGTWAVSAFREGDLLIPEVLNEDMDHPDFILMNEPESLAQGRKVRDVAILKRFCWMLPHAYLILYARDEETARKVAVGVMAGIGCVNQHQALN